jgi:hypothetical protein
MYNKKTLSKATAELDKAKAPKKPKDIITDPMGQWKYPGLPTRIPSNDITMKGVGYPVLGVANNGQRKIMLPGADYTFPGAEYVDEYPQMKKGGTKKKRKTKSIMGMNKLMQKGPLFQDYSKRVYDPNVDYFQGGGYIEAELTDDEIEEYRKGGFIVEDISVPELNQAQKGGAKDKFATHIGDDGTVGTTSVHTDKKGNITTKVQDSKGITHYKVKTKDGKVFYKQDASTTYPKSNSVSQENYKPDPREIEMNDGALQSVDDVWTLPIGMTSAGLKGTVGLVKGLTSLGRNALKSSLVQAGRAGLKKSLIKSLPGSSINNLVASEFAGTALTDIVTGKVAEPWKKANKSGKVSDYVDAVAENMYTALDAIPLYNAAGKGLKQLGKLAKTQNKSSKLSKVTAYNDALQNEYWPKSLTEHPDAEYVLQKTPVKDFGIRPNIKNLPTKQTRGYDINEKDVHQLINQNLEYLTHPNYIKRRQSVTGETTKQIKKDIDSYINNLKKSDIDLGLNIEYPGGHIRGDRKWFLGKKSKDVTGVNPDKVSSRTEALHVLDHEIGHALSPANQSTFKGMPKYKNYPNLKISKKIDKDGYLGSDYEQQVRFNRIKNYLNNKYGISKHEPISEKDFDLFANDYNKWVNEEHMVQGKGNMPRGMQDIGEMLTGHTQTAGQSAKTRRNIIAGINRSWALAPVGITGAALMNMPKQQKAKQMKKGGIVADLTHAEIQDYIKQGYIVEDVK